LFTIQSIIWEDRKKLKESTFDSKISEENATLKLLLKEKEQELSIIVSLMNSNGRTNNSNGANVTRDRLKDIISEAESKSTSEESVISKVVVNNNTKSPPDPKISFKQFCESYPDAQAIEDNNKLRKSKMLEAKEYAAIVNESKETISNSHS
jgi:hypothetical protein